MTYAFTFDASACTGCKACQVACKDKNNLPVGVLWRRVYEVSGGSWQRMGDAWVTDVFAYNLSIACNHCVHPKCAGVCPTDAFVQREDGIVYIDTSKCIGCGYCSWACPYSAPRYNPELGYMTKCNFCYDDIDAGLAPACVAACPMRVLDFVTIEDGRQMVEYGPSSVAHPPQTEGKHQLLWKTAATEHPFPLPQQSRTEPHLAIQPHLAMTNSLQKTIANGEEVKPGKRKSELPLVAFTLLGQMAAGMALFSFFSGRLSVPVLAALGALIGLAGLSSLLHLGAPLNAWRAPLHLKKSWLSREILVFGLFAGSWLLILFLPEMGKLPLAVFGTGLVYSMAQVYRLRSMPAWNTNGTTLAFALSALLLGGFGLEVIDIFAGVPAGRSPLINVAVAAGLVFAFALALVERDQAYQTARRLRLGLILLGLAGMLAVSFLPDTMGRWITVLIFILVLFEQVLGRWQFYAYLHKRTL
jgi:anaerobic dimethyl sulfoxide reductase subunit B